MLTKTKIKKMAIGHKICDGNGVYFKKTSEKAGNWTYRYIIDKKAREIGLGSFPVIQSADAQRKADSFRRMREDGKDPKIERDKLKLERYRARIGGFPP